MDKDFTLIPIVNMSKHIKQIFGLVSHREIQYDEDGYEYIKRNDEYEIYVRISALPKELKEEIEKYLEDE